MFTFTRGIYRGSGLGSTPTRKPDPPLSNAARSLLVRTLAYTRYCLVSGPLCTDRYYSLRTHPLFRQPTPPRHRPHYCAIQCFPPNPRYCNIYHTILEWQYRVKANTDRPVSRIPLPARGRSGPNLQPGTVCVCGMKGLRKGMHTTQHPPSPTSRAGTDLSTNVQAGSRAVSYVNTHRPRFQVRARPPYALEHTVSRRCTRVCPGEPKLS